MVVAPPGPIRRPGSPVNWVQTALFSPPPQPALFTLVSSAGAVHDPGDPENELIALGSAPAITHITESRNVPLYSDPAVNCAWSVTAHGLPTVQLSAIVSV